MEGKETRGREGDKGKGRRQGEGKKQREGKIGKGNGRREDIIFSCPPNMREIFRNKTFLRSSAAYLMFSHVSIQLNP